MTTTINTKTCTRCLGSGEYNYNLKDGHVCYGCGGTGKMIVAPKGQKKAQATATKTTSGTGDIIEVASVLYQVEEIRWIRYREVALYSSAIPTNQQLKITRLIDGKTLFLKRSIFNEDGMGVMVTPDEWVGKLVGTDKRSIVEE